MGTRTSIKANPRSICIVLSYLSNKIAPSLISESNRKSYIRIYKLIQVTVKVYNSNICSGVSYIYDLDVIKLLSREIVDSTYASSLSPFYSHCLEILIVIEFWIVVLRVLTPHSIPISIPNQFVQCIHITTHLALTIFR
jgi:hypothetical protein